MSTSILNASADRNEQGLGTVLHFHLPIREVLTRDIERDTHVGDRLAIEEKVCDQFGVSRELMRDAWRGLDSDGIISRSRGQGTFVERLASACRETRLTGLSYDAEARELAKGALVAADVGPPNDGHAARRKWCTTSGSLSLRANPSLCTRFCGASWWVSRRTARFCAACQTVNMLRQSQTLRKRSAAH
jgi:DNA-binding transcriptional regulator YhcF (GntR family)